MQKICQKTRPGWTKQAVEETTMELAVGTAVADGGVAAAQELPGLLRVLKALKMPAMKTEAPGDSRPWQASILAAQTAACQTPWAGWARGRSQSLSGSLSGSRLMDGRCLPAV